MDNRNPPVWKRRAAPERASRWAVPGGGRPWVSDVGSESPVACPRGVSLVVAWQQKTQVKRRRPRWPESSRWNWVSGTPSPSPSRAGSAVRESPFHQVAFAGALFDGARFAFLFVNRSQRPVGARSSKDVLLLPRVSDRPRPAERDLSPRP